MQVHTVAVGGFPVGSSAVDDAEIDKAATDDQAIDERAIDERGDAAGVRAAERQAAADADEEGIGPPLLVVTELEADDGAGSETLGQDGPEGDGPPMLSAPEALLRPVPVIEDVNDIVITYGRRADEFVCDGCFLLKDREQLADTGRHLCRDCVESCPPAA